jgi:hypothetical protein
MWRDNLGPGRIQQYLDAFKNPRTAFRFPLKNLGLPLVLGPSVQFPPLYQLSDHDIAVLRDCGMLNANGQPDVQLISGMILRLSSVNPSDLSFPQIIGALRLQQEKPAHRTISSSATNAQSGSPPPSSLDGLKPRQKKILEILAKLKPGCGLEAKEIQRKLPKEGRPEESTLRRHDIPPLMALGLIVNTPGIGYQLPEHH